MPHAIKESEPNVFAPTGQDLFSVTAKGEEDATLTLTLFANVLVEGITFSDGYVYLISGDQKYLLSDVAEVRMGQ